MKKVIIILLFFAGSSFWLQGQSASLGMDTSATFANPVSFNGTDNFVVSVHNYGLLAYADSVDVVYAVDSSSNGAAPVILISHVVAMSIAANGSYTDSATLTIASGTFRSGINTVVIWPRMIATPFTTHDSLKLSLLVNPSAIDGHEIINKPNIYPNPAGERIYIQNNDPNFVIEQVRILDATGQTICNGTFKGSIDLGKLATGFYTLELSGNKGKPVHYKIIKE